MVLLPSPESFNSASGVINMPLLNAYYKSFIDESFLDMGRTITLHLPPVKQQDTTTQSQTQPSQYNPYFGRVQAPKTNRRNTGVTITHRDVEYTAHIKVGPMKGDDAMGIGDLAENQVVVTLAIAALDHANQALSMSIEGRRYQIDETRPIGLTQRDYLMVFGTEINEASIDTSANAG